VLGVFGRRPQTMKIENYCFVTSSKSRKRTHKVSIDNMANEDSLLFVI